MTVQNRQITDVVDFIPLNNPTTAIVDGEFPASGSYIDIASPNSPSNVTFLAVVHAVDEDIVLQVKEALTVSGTPKNISLATVTIASTAALNDKYAINVEVTKMDINSDYRFLTLDVSGATGADDFISLYLLTYDSKVIPITATDNLTVVNVVAGQP
jgi:hypothetical protein